MLRYKDYIGSVEFDDGSLVVKILHIDDTIVDEFTDASEAQERFEALVDDYIETCAAIGKDPQRPFKGTFNVRVAPATHRRAAMAATEAGQTLNSWVNAAIDRALEEPRQYRHAMQIYEHIFDRRVVASQASAWASLPWTDQARGNWSDRISGLLHKPVARRVEVANQSDLTNLSYVRVQGNG